MDETLLGTLAVAALAVCILDSFLWMWGGRKGKYKRRFIGSAVQTLGLNIISVVSGTWCWQFLASLGPEIGSRSMGYGGDTTSEKIMRRSVFAVGSLGVGVLLAWGAGFDAKALTVLACQGIASIISVILGVKNPVPAAVEEAFICFTLKYMNYLYPFVRMI